MNMPIRTCTDQIATPVSPKLAIYGHQRLGYPIQKRTDIRAWGWTMSRIKEGELKPGDEVLVRSFLQNGWMQGFANADLTWVEFKDDDGKVVGFTVGLAFDKEYGEWVSTCYLDSKGLTDISF